MDGRVCSRNIREYVPRGQPPVYNYERNSSREKVNVWAGLCGNGTIVGPFFSDVNVTGQVYLNLINEEIIPQVMESFHYNLFEDVLFRNMWWF